MVMRVTSHSHARDEVYQAWRTDHHRRPHAAKSKSSQLHVGGVCAYTLPSLITRTCAERNRFICGCHRGRRGRERLISCLGNLSVGGNDAAQLPAAPPVSAIEAQVKRSREIFEFHLVRIQLPQRKNSSVNLDACCATGSWVPPEGCASRCRIFLRVCLFAKNHFDKDAGTGLNISKATSVANAGDSNSVVIYPCVNSLGDLTTGIVLLNNELINTSLDHQLQMNQRNQVSGQSGRR
ncbi:unnamed protein product [Schistocephalus solidus]|uniref:Thyroglobulin type-1 domain-containing protein n=1 Tax=Schistocephalus solidus TaxID=70667 RepID=A0A183TCC8_SCHSO|nr:unnamed protein product [Schistocephalus solidus]